MLVREGKGREEGEVLVLQTGYDLFYFVAHVCGGAYVYMYAYVYV